MCSRKPHQDPYLQFPLAQNMIDDFLQNLDLLYTKVDEHKSALHANLSAFYAATPDSIDQEILTIEALLLVEKIEREYEKWIDKYEWVLGTDPTMLVEIAGMKVKESEREELRAWFRSLRDNNHSDLERYGAYEKSLRLWLRDRDHDI